MQSLTQAVYRFICFHSREGRSGVGAVEIIEEMRSRGYSEPLRERVSAAIRVSPISGAITGPDVVKVSGRYFQKRAYQGLRARL